MYSDALEQSSGIILTDYRGLRVSEMEQLRRSIRETGSTIHVTKNRLLKQALEAKELAIPDGWLEGPTAVAFCHGEIPPVAKVLSDVSKESPLTIKGGMMGTSLIESTGVHAIASLPPREVLLAQMLGTFNAPATQAAGAIASGVRQVLNLLQAYVDKLEGGATAPQAA